MTAEVPFQPLIPRGLYNALYGVELRLRSKSMPLHKRRSHTSHTKHEFVRLCIPRGYTV